MQKVLGTKGMAGFALAVVGLMLMNAAGALAPVPAPVPGPAPTGTFACNASDPIPPLLKRAGIGGYAESPDAGSWQTWYVSPDQAPIVAPPDTASAQTVQELADLALIQLTRTDADVQKAREYDQGGASEFWEEKMFKLLVTHSAKAGSKNPPRMARALAMFEMSMYDAGVAVFAAKYCYNRPAPSVLLPILQPVVTVRSEPSFPSEHAAMAAAAFEIFQWFFPCPDESNATTCEEPPSGLQAQLDEAMHSRLVAGVNYQSDLDAGAAIGHAVAQAVIAARANDGSQLTWTGTTPVGDCLWKPKVAGAKPVEPLWGGVTPFLMSSGDQFRAPPPLNCHSTAFMAQTQALYDTSFSLTDRQREIG
ncbi:MAG: hypothetical protein LC624_08950, partial [Halobacteriales archaeon]|nr:hypothetical protein [Halobacteriales archaeon]